MDCRNGGRPGAARAECGADEPPAMRASFAKKGLGRLIPRIGAAPRFNIAGKAADPLRSERREWAGEGLVDLTAKGAQIDHAITTLE
jgi:hypothetical protein